MKRKITVYIDGSCKGNPGPGTSLALFQSQDEGKAPITFTRKNPLPYTTNNRAEYDALILALNDLNNEVEWLVESDTVMHITIYTDSQLLVGHLCKHWRVNKNKDLYQKAKSLMNSISKKHNIQLQWIPRDKNLAGIKLEELN